MENQEEKKGYNITITYKSKSKGFKVVDSKQNLKITLNNLKQLANSRPEEYWHLPEMNNGGQRITYLLGRVDEAKRNEVFHEKNSDGDLLSLEDYGVKEGDNLILIHKVIAG